MKSCIQAIKTRTFHQFLCASFWAQNIQIPPIHIQLKFKYIHRFHIVSTIRKDFKPGENYGRANVSGKRLHLVTLQRESKKQRKESVQNKLKANSPDTVFFSYFHFICSALETFILMLNFSLFFFLSKLS